MTSPNVLMIFPRFNQNTFWNMQSVCDTYGVRCPAPPLGLMTLAALLPRHWNIKLVNRNAEELTGYDIAWADMVMTGGMLPQRKDTLDLIALCQAQGKPVVIGGPDPTSSPEVYGSADFRVLGEAEDVIQQFIEAWEAGERRGVFEAKRSQVDVTRSPIPRFDLIDFDHYLYICVQFSRGCPFNCEFCDIIELYGRVPRTKTNAQMLAELQALYDAGYRRHIDFVDDNLIGNKKALKRFLPALIEWQRKHGYPFQFSTEASINLADDAQLLAMLREANFFAIFVGIESPDNETLIKMQKKQNTRRDLGESVHKIYAAGMFVTAGFIIGFDTERGSIADGMIDCINATAIPNSMVGLLTALPSTQFGRRLAAEDRLRPLPIDFGDQCVDGLNFKTLRPRKEVLEDYRTVIAAIYEPAAYFGRVRRVGRALRPRKLEIKRSLTMRHLGFAFRLIWRMTFERPELRAHFWGTLVHTVRHNPSALSLVIILLTPYLHLGTFARFVVDQLERQIAALEADTTAVTAPAPAAVAAPASAA